MFDRHAGTQWRRSEIVHFVRGLAADQGSSSTRRATPTSVAHADDIPARGCAGDRHWTVLQLHAVCARSARFFRLVFSAHDAVKSPRRSAMTQLLQSSLASFAFRHG
jgi:hypothetical protein